MEFIHFNPKIVVGVPLKGTEPGLGFPTTAPPPRYHFHRLEARPLPQLNQNIFHISALRGSGREIAFWRTLGPLRRLYSTITKR